MKARTILAGLWRAFQCALWERKQDFQLHWAGRDSMKYTQGQLTVFFDVTHNESGELICFCEDMLYPLIPGTQLPDMGAPLSATSERTKIVQNIVDALERMGHRVNVEHLDATGKKWIDHLNERVNNLRRQVSKD